MFLELLIFNIIMLSLPLIGCFYGLTQTVYVTDLSHMTALISVLMFTSVVVSIYTALRNVYDQQLIHFLRFLSKIYLFLGLIGTVIGLSIMVRYLHFSDGETASTAVSTILTGISSSLRTVFFATMFGLIAKIWTETNIYIFKRHEFKRYLNDQKSV